MVPWPGFHSFRLNAHCVNSIWKMLLLIIVNVLQIYILHVPRGVSSFILKKRICSYKWYIIISDSESSIHQMEGHFYYRKQTHKQVRVRRINTNQTLNKKTKLPFLDLDKRYCMTFVQMGSTWRNVKTDFIVHKCTLRNW